MFSWLSLLSGLTEVVVVFAKMAANRQLMRAGEDRAKVAQYERLATALAEVQRAMRAVRSDPGSLRDDTDRRD